MWRKWMALALVVLTLAGGLALAEEQVQEPLTSEPAPSSEPMDEGKDAPKMRQPEAVEPAGAVEPPEPIAEEETVEPPKPQPEETEATGEMETADDVEDDPSLPQDDGMLEEPKVIEEPEVIEMPEAAEELDEAERLNLDEALSFWQDGSPELRYDWDEDSQRWVAEALSPMELPVYVTNTSDQTIGPLNIVAGGQSMTDGGGLYRLTCELLDAENLILQPGECRRIATFIFSGEGGGTDVACEQQLSIDLRAEYA